MSSIALPDVFEDPAQFSLQQVAQQRANSSNFDNSEQVIDLMGDRWRLSVTLPNRSHEEAAQIEAYVASMRGKVNTSPFWHLQRPEPRGTMRGAPVLALPLFRRDPNLIVTTEPGATLLAGDMVGCAGLLFQVAADCVADGAGQLYVPVVNRSRKAAPAGTAVVWFRPTAEFRFLAVPAPVQYIPGYTPEITFDYVEAVP